MAFELKKNPEVIYVCGTGQGWEHIPQNTNATLYCLNDYIKFEKYKIRPDKLFIMDILDEKPQVVSGLDNLGEVIARINQMKVPLVSPYKYEEIPLSEAFPLEKCVNELGMPYFTNTICYMIAYAILAGAKEIQTWGVNQAGSHEYTEERGGVEYWLGVAHGRGIKVQVNGKHSQLMRYKGRYGTGRTGILYGYLQPYEAIVGNQDKFGELVVKKLAQPQPNKGRDLRPGRLK